MQAQRKRILLRFQLHRIEMGYQDMRQILIEHIADPFLFLVSVADIRIEQHIAVRVEIYDVSALHVEAFKGILVEPLLVRQSHESQAVFFCPAFGQDFVWRKRPLLVHRLIKRKASVLFHRLRISRFMKLVETDGQLSLIHISTAFS